LGNIINPIIEFLIQILVFFYDNVYPNYGVDIILLTIVVRIAMLPLTFTQIRAQSQIQKIQPEINKIREKYKDDREKMNQEIMSIYRENKINPLSGCLPLLLQLPVIIALYMMIQKYAPINAESFLWINELGKPDPYYILVILFVVTSFITQQMMVTDPSQKFINYIMPIAMGILFIRFPAAFFVYFDTSNIWQLGERFIITKIFKPREEKSNLKKHKK
jgi:YidC/Oxa1 family membrane protein insertase